MPDPTITTPAPPRGRTPIVVQAGGRTFRITPLPPRQALRVAFRVVKIVGEPIAELFSGAGLNLGLRNPETDEPMRVTFEVLLHYKVAREALVGRLVQAVADVEADDLTDLIDDLLVRHLEVETAGAFLPLVTAEAIDNEVPDLWALLALVRAAFGASALPTSAAAGSSADR